MPWSVDSPPDAARKYSPKCQRAFVHAANSVLSDTHDEGKAVAAGHAAARRCEGKQSSMNDAVGDVKFNIYTGLLKAAPLGEDGVKRLKTTASSTITDLAGDEMELSALQSMARTAEQNMTIFLNHRYQVPEDVLGSVEKAEIKAGPGGMYDLDFDIRVDEANDRAVKAWTQINNGTKLGCSIGARIPEGGYERTKSGLRIKDVYLMEASIVGIPANPRSFVQYATKALHEAESEDEPETTTADVNINLNLDGPQSVTVGESGAEIVTSAVKGGPRPENEKDEPKPDEPVTVAEGGESGLEETTVETTETTTETTIESDDGPSDEEDSAGSDEPSQEADKAVPESDGIDDEDTRAVLAKGIETLETLLRAQNEELANARKALASETEMRVKAESERDEAKKDLKLARDIVERISALPIGRRTSFKAAASEFRTKFSAVYDDEVIKLLERDSNNGK